MKQEQSDGMMKEAWQGHLGDEEWLCKENVARHIEECSSCRMEKENLERGLLEFREQAHAAAARPQDFWERQRISVLRRTGSVPPLTVRRLAWRWAAAACFAVVAAVLLLKNDAQPAPDFAAGSDQELLIGVERTLRNEIPEALQPLLLITNELDEALRTSAEARR